MCLVAVALDAHPDFSLLIAANRDEVLARPSAPLAHWSDAPDIVGGRDLDKGGTWLALTTTGPHGRVALVTNYRDFRRTRREGAPSRGALVADYLRGSDEAAAFVARIARQDDAFEPYNLLVGTTGALTWHSNVSGETRTLEPGRVHGLSNALLDTPWPKVTALVDTTTDALARATPATVQRLEDELLAALARRDRAPAERLPDTGVGPELESALSPAFVRLEGYGTRCSSVITVTCAGHVRFIERTYDEAGNDAGTRLLELSVASDGP